MLIHTDTLLKVGELNSNKTDSISEIHFYQE